MAYNAPQDSLVINGSGEVDILNKVNIGKGSGRPTLLLDGANGESISSQIIFGDSGTTHGGTYKQGMVIFYDSTANHLRIAGDQDADAVLDTPEHININRQNGNTGFGVQSPSHRLDVSGNIGLSGNIIFNDGSTINTNKLYLCKVKYVSLGDLATNSTWVIPQNQFDSSFLINEGGFSLGTNGITIPVSGYYEIHIVNYFNNITNDRGSIISAIAINGSYSNEDYICGSYIRFDSGTRGSRGNAGTIVRYLTAGQQVCTAFYETGDSSVVNISTSGGSSFSLKRIG
jgi:hypothetical protein